MKTAVALSIIILLFVPAGAAYAAALQDSTNPTMKSLDDLKFKADAIRDRVESRLTDLNIAEGMVNSSGGSLDAGKRTSYRTLAQQGAVDADGWDAEIYGVEKKLWELQSSYNPGQFTNAEGVRIEGRMDVLQSEIGQVRKMNTDIRVVADRIERQT
ncbi:MAG TPA: hypothetical protein VK436_13975 [Methanocella sp.]|nr:hypothetical protein [Methanocella sp.]